MRREHWPGVARVYAEGIAGGHATFETTVPSWKDWDDSHLREHRFVALDAGEVVGWAALAPVSDRCLYGGVAENSVYVASAARRRGVGRALLEALIASAEASGIWTIQAGIFPENEMSVRSTSAAAFASSAGANVSRSATGSGATSSCSRGAAGPSSDRPARVCC